jgi:uncharacterized heparinase superfamily protein
MRPITQLYNTIRFLKPVQLYGRVLFRTRRPRPELGPPPHRAQQRGSWTSPVAGRPRLLAKDRIVLIGSEACISTPLAWNNPSFEKLWLYNLHYFDDLNAQAAASRADWHNELIGRWIAENPPGTGNGWEPYPVSLRIVNWVKWALSGVTLDREWEHSLAVQTRWLAKRIEYHLLGNHLLANAKALVFAGLYFDGLEPRVWLEQGLRILEKELTEQILPDGGHFELSPMYHALVWRTCSIS